MLLNITLIKQSSFTTNDVYCCTCILYIPKGTFLTEIIYYAGSLLIKGLYIFFWWWSPGDGSWEHLQKWLRALSEGRTCNGEVSLQLIVKSAPAINRSTLPSAEMDISDRWKAWGKHLHKVQASWGTLTEKSCEALKTKTGPTELVRQSHSVCIFIC